LVALVVAEEGRREQVVDKDRRDWVAASNVLDFENFAAGPKRVVDHIDMEALWPIGSE
jgi:hypothetical protein